MRLAWLALLLASASLILSFGAIGEARDTWGELDHVVAQYEAQRLEFNAAVESYNRAVADYDEIVTEYNEIAALHEAQRLEFNAAVESYNEISRSFQEQLEWFDRLRVEVERELGHSL